MVSPIGGSPQIPEQGPLNALGGWKAQFYNFGSKINQRLIQWEGVLNQYDKGDITLDKAQGDIHAIIYGGYISPYGPTPLSVLMSSAESAIKGGNPDVTTLTDWTHFVGTMLPIDNTINADPDHGSFMNVTPDQLQAAQRLISEALNEIVNPS